MGSHSMGGHSLCMEMEDVVHWLWITKPPSIQVLHDSTFLKAGEIIQHAKVLSAGDVV
jgi:hypothetical protein